MMKQKIWRFIKPVVRPVGMLAIKAVFYLLRIFPIKKNKVLACVSYGIQYDDNQKFIMEELHKFIPDLDIVWVKDPKYEYELPEWMRPVKWRS